MHDSLKCFISSAFISDGPWTVNIDFLYFPMLNKLIKIVKKKRHSQATLAELVALTTLRWLLFINGSIPIST